MILVIYQVDLETRRQTLHIVELSSNNLLCVFTGTQERMNQSKRKNDQSQLLCFTSAFLMDPRCQVSRF